MYICICLCVCICSHTYTIVSSETKTAQDSVERASSDDGAGFLEGYIYIYIYVYTHIHTHKLLGTISHLLETIIAYEVCYRHSLIVRVCQERERERDIYTYTCIYIYIYIHIDR